MYIDSHLHLSNEDYDIDEVIKRAKENDVRYFITGGTNKENNLCDIELSKKYEEIYITLGYHPEYADEITEEDLELLENQLLENKEKVVGIGEIGLDYHYTKENKEKQIWLLKRQIEIANKYNLPVVIHSRDATFDTYNILKKMNAKGVIHCFSGSLEIAKEYIKLGFKLGIGGVVTFKNSKLKDVVKELNTNNILLETDSPYLSPQRGFKNEPKNIKIIANYIGGLWNLNEKEMQKIILNNTLEVFNIKAKKNSF